MEERIKMFIGAAVLENMMLVSKLEELQKKVKELEDRWASAPAPPAS